MIMKHICKNPKCSRFNKIAEYYCCKACARIHKSTIIKTKERKIMDKIKRAWTYTTSDGRSFSGKSAAKEAKEHQRKLNFKEDIKSIIPRAREIFNIAGPNPCDEDGETNEELFLNKVLVELDWDGADFEDFLSWLITAYLEIPELFRFFQFIEEKWIENNINKE